VVWLPQAKVLFAGDLVIQGRYPFIHRGEVLKGVPQWIEALKWLSSLGADVIVPGHGSVCGDEEITVLLNYLENTWALTTDHIADGHSLDEILADLDYPRQKGWSKRMFRKNIELMYTAISSKNEMR